MNTSLNVLTELSQSYDLAEKMFSKQENFSVQVEKNLAETLSSFNNINQFFENVNGKKKLEDTLSKSSIMLISYDFYFIYISNVI
jgi:hypothetical protein